MHACQDSVLLRLELRVDSKIAYAIWYVLLHSVYLLNISSSTHSLRHMTRPPHVYTSEATLSRAKCEMRHRRAWGGPPSSFWFRSLSLYLSVLITPPPIFFRSLLLAPSHTHTHTHTVAPSLAACMLFRIGMLILDAISAYACTQTRMQTKNHIHACKHTHSTRRSETPESWLQTNTTILI